MTAIEYAQHYIKTEDAARFYVRLAQGEVMSYCNIPSGDYAALDPHAVEIGKIAVLYYRRDKEADGLWKSHDDMEAAGQAGLKADSFSENGVSESHTYLDATEICDKIDDIYEQYQAQIKAILQGMNDIRRAKVLHGTRR